MDDYAIGFPHRLMACTLGALGGPSDRSSGFAGGGGITRDPITQLFQMMQQNGGGGTIDPAMLFGAPPTPNMMPQPGGGSVYRTPTQRGGSANPGGGGPITLPVIDPRVYASGGAAGRTGAAQGENSDSNADHNTGAASYDNWKDGLSHTLDGIMMATGPVGMMTGLSTAKGGNPGSITNGFNGFWSDLNNAWDAVRGNPNAVNGPHVQEDLPGGGVPSAGPFTNEVQPEEVMTQQEIQDAIAAGIAGQKGEENVGGGGDEGEEGGGAGGPDDSGTAGDGSQGSGSEGMSASVEGNYSKGGEVRGPGTTHSDSIPAHLSDEEHVVSADDVKAIGGGNFAKGHQIIAALGTQARRKQRGGAHGRKAGGRARVV